MSEVSQPNLIETIEKAFQQTSDGAYEYIEENHREWLRTLVKDNKRLSEALEKRVTERYDEVMRDLDEGLENYREENRKLSETLGRNTFQLQQTREELTESQSMLKYNQEMYDQVFESRKVVEAELEQVKAERDEARKDAFISRERLYRYRTELSAKNNALESIANSKAYTSRQLMRSIARSILKDYEVIPNETE